MITLNGQPSELSGSIADLVEHRFGSRTRTGVAVAVNEEIVCRDDWERWSVNDGDRIEIVTAVQGG
jgi:sulfur carrier protein